MSDSEFEQFSKHNRPYKIERASDGSFTVHEPAGYLSSRMNAEINRQLANWNHRYKLGEVADSSGGFVLPDHSVKSPDAAWTSNDRIMALSSEERERNFSAVCPDFVIELKSKTDAIEVLKLKMKMWIENGCRLGWLIDPDKEIVYVFSNVNVSVHIGFDLPISGEPVLMRFELVLGELRFQ